MSSRAGGQTAQKMDYVPRLPSMPFWAASEVGIQRNLNLDKTLLLLRADDGQAFRLASPPPSGRFDQLAKVSKGGFGT